jgi:hypothetical protein
MFQDECNEYSWPDNNSWTSETINMRYNYIIRHSIKKDCK